MSSLRGFGLAAGAENSYRGRWPQPPLLMRLLVVLFFVAGALDLWLELRTRMEEGGLRPRFF